MAKFPKQVYVVRENEGTDDEFLVIHEGVPDERETTEAALYELKTVGKVEVTRRFVEKKGR